MEIPFDEWGDPKRGEKTERAIFGEKEAGYFGWEFKKKAENRPWEGIGISGSESPGAAKSPEGSERARRAGTRRGSRRGGNSPDALGLQLRGLREQGVGEIRADPGAGLRIRQAKARGDVSPGPADLRALIGGELREGFAIAVGFAPPEKPILESPGADLEKESRGLEKIDLGAPVGFEDGPVEGPEKAGEIF